MQNSTIIPDIAVLLVVSTHIFEQNLIIASNAQKFALVDMIYYLIDYHTHVILILVGLNIQQDHSTLKNLEKLFNNSFESNQMIL